MLKSPIAWLIFISFFFYAGCSTTPPKKSEPPVQYDAQTQHAMDTGKRRVSSQVGTGPLGSKGNPVKADGFEGAKDYIASLKGPAGQTLSYEELGSAGIGPFESLVYLYNVTYEKHGQPVTVQIFFDIDFEGYQEKQPVSGLTRHKP